MEVDQLELLVELGLDWDAVVVATCACRFPELVVVVLHRDQRRGDRDHSRQKVFVRFCTERENDLEPTLGALHQKKPLVSCKLFFFSILKMEWGR